MENSKEAEIMKIVVITSSPRSKKKSTSEFLAEKFIEGAESNGHEIFRFDAGHSEINPCRGCDYCGMDGDCAIKDDISKNLTAKLVECDLIVLTTPLYYFGVSAQLKIVIDRFYARTGRISGKKSILIATAWNSDSWTMQALDQYYQTLVRYMRWQNLGAIYAVGCGYRDAVERSKFVDQALKLGKSI